LGHRIVRGWVVGVDGGDAANLKELKAVSSPVPIFGTDLLQTLKWAASHYVAPVAAVLPRAGPPNLPRGTKTAIRAAPIPTRSRSAYLISRPDEFTAAIDAVTPIVDAGRSAMVIVGTGVEALVFAKELRGRIGKHVVEVSPDADARDVTAAWTQVCTEPGHVVVGTHRIAFWPVAELSLVVLIEEGRRAMKDRQTPTIHAREIVRRRAMVERFDVLYVGGVPSTQIVALGVEIRRVAARAWPPVEIVDRRPEPPGSGLIGDRARGAIRGAVARGGRVFVFSHRHGYAPASRCVNCKTVRRCPSCGARPEPGERCTRCGAELGPCTTCGGRRFEPLGAGVDRVAEALRRLNEGEVGAVGSVPPIWVGTERDIPLLHGVSLGVVVDTDGLVLGSAYNAGEEALRIVARLARAIPFGGGRRLLLQTNLPGHPVLEAVRSGDPLPFLREELEARREFGLPPAGEVIVVEVSGGARDARQLLAERLPDEATVYGPAERSGRLRWLIQGRDLTRTRAALRGVVEALRGAGGSVRVDADPLDL
jgi:primosomal protein N' (replication factor Y) (superfamily II helicase)